MKLLFLVFVAMIFSSFVFVVAFLFLNRVKVKKYLWKKPLITALVAFVLLAGFIFLGAYASSKHSDLQCSTSHVATNMAPSNLKTAQDYFLQANYDYDIGNCKKAVSDYSKAIEINPNFSQALNNRAYTNMRLRNYQDALTDLDKAIELNKNYIEALMNRGDIHNYYYQIDRQKSIEDYKRVIVLTGPSGGGTSVCGHFFLAKHNGWTLGAYLGYFKGEFFDCR